MSASGPPSDDLPPLHGRTGPQSFAWGKSPNVVSEIVGRDHELERVRALLAVTREGATTTLVVEGEPGIGKTTLLEAAERMATGFRCLWVRGVESESVLAHAGLLQALGPIRDRLAEISGAQAIALSLALGWGPAAASFRALSCSRGGAVHARRGVRTGTGAGAGRRPAVGRPRVGSCARVRGSSPPRGPSVLPVGGAKRLDLAGVRAGNARPDTRWPVPRRRPCTWSGIALRTESSSAWSRTPAAIRSGSWRSPAASPMPSEWVPRRCPTRCPWATVLGLYTSSSSPACPHPPASRTAVRA